MQAPPSCSLSFSTSSDSKGLRRGKHQQRSADSLSPKVVNRHTVRCLIVRACAVVVAVRLRRLDASNLLAKSAKPASRIKVLALLVLLRILLRAHRSKARVVAAGSREWRLLSKGSHPHFLVTALMLPTTKIFKTILSQHSSLKWCKPLERWFNKSRCHRPWWDLTPFKVPTTNS